MDERQQEIRDKGFRLYSGKNSSYGKIKVGVKTIDDATLNLTATSKIYRRYNNKMFILKAISDRDLPLMRDISNYFYNTNGIYQRVCDYISYLYRYDWYITPEIFDESVSQDKVLSDFNKILSYLDNSHIKKVCGDIALSVVKDGAYYGYVIPSDTGLILQQLPANYCRSRYSVGGNPAIEFNMRYFDDLFGDLNYRIKVLKMFPKDFQIGYMKYKQGKLNNDKLLTPTATRSRTERIYDPVGCWYLLDPASCVKFSISNEDQPFFINAIPSLIDLEKSQDLDRQKQAQALNKLVIQKLPLDKNGDLIFDIDEARDIHNNAVEMLQDTIGLNVMTTFADVDVEDMQDENSSTASDDLERMERSVYNMFGISRNLFNTDGNLSLEKSILDDESTMRGLVEQFEMFFNKITSGLGKNKKKYNYRLYMLETTQYNYRDLAKMYKEQVQLGYSKMLPQIAMGHSQSSIIHTAYFENEVLRLSEIMIPPLMSSTMNAEALLGNKSGDTSSNNSSGDNKNSTVKVMETEEKSAGRPEKSDSEKSEKTIANKESMN